MFIGVCIVKLAVDLDERIVDVEVVDSVGGVRRLVVNFLAIPGGTN